MRIGAAPVSFGVYGPSEDDAGFSPDRLVEAMAASGYEGAEFPAAGFAGPPGGAARLFEKHGLQPVGIYIPIHFADPTLRAVDEQRMEDALGDLDAARAGPRIAILADEGSGHTPSTPRTRRRSHPCTHRRRVRGTDRCSQPDSDPHSQTGIGAVLPSPHQYLCGKPLRDRETPGFHRHRS